MATCTDRVYHNQGNKYLVGFVPPGKKVLDCGCGAGDNARLLVEQGCSVVGITISSEEAALAQRYCTSVIVADLEVGLPQAVSEPFDIVIASHVLEHLRRPEVMLADIRRVLSPTGLVVVALPNVLNYRDRLNFVLGNFDYTETGVMDQTHVHFYTYRTGQELLEMNGFQVISASAQGAFPLWKLRKLLPKAAMENLDNLACKNYPGLFALQNVYTAQIAPTRRESSSP